MEGRRHILTVNVHTLIGGVIGLVSLFIPWVVKNDTDRYNLIDMILGRTSLGFGLDYLLPLMSVVVLIGVILVFISPYGASASIGGASAIYFLVGIAATANSEAVTIAVGPGVLMCILSGAVAFASIVFPFGFGYGYWKPLGNRGRNYTFSFYRDINDSDGLPIWWWAFWPGWFWYWRFEMQWGWAFRDLYRKHRERQRLKAERMVREEAIREFGSNDSEMDKKQRVRR